MFNLSRPDWPTAKQMLGDVNFLKKLQEYDANHIPESTIKKLKPYVEHKDFQPAVRFLEVLLNHGLIFILSFRSLRKSPRQQDRCALG